MTCQLSFNEGITTEACLKVNRKVFPVYSYIQSCYSLLNIISPNVFACGATSNESSMAKRR